MGTETLGQLAFFFLKIFFWAPFCLYLQTEGGVKGEREGNDTQRSAPRAGIEPGSAALPASRDMSLPRSNHSATGLDSMKVF